MAEKKLTLKELEKRIEKLEKHRHYLLDALGCTEPPIYPIEPVREKKASRDIERQ